MRDDYLKPEIKSSIYDFNKKLTEHLCNGNFQVNSDVDDKFYLILLDKDFRKNLGVNYDNVITSTDEEYNAIISEGRTNVEEEVIYTYLNMKLIFDISTDN